MPRIAKTHFKMVDISPSKATFGLFPPFNGVCAKYDPQTHKHALNLKLTRIRTT